MRMGFGMRKHGSIQDIFQSGLEVAVDVGQRQHPLILLQRHIAVSFKNHPVHRQRAGFIGTEHVHGPEVLDRVQPLHDHLLPAHADRPFRQADCHHHGQHLRRQTDRHRDGKEKGLTPVAFGDTIDDEHQRNHHQHEPENQPRELRDTLIKGCRRLLFREGSRHTTQIRLFPCGNHHRGAGTALHAGAKEGDTGKLDRCYGRGICFHRKLLDGKTLPSQRTLIHEQILGCDQSHVGWDHVPCRQGHHVTGHQLCHQYFPRLTATDDRGHDGNHRLELGRRVVGPRLLNAFQPGAQSDHQRHHGAGTDITGGE